MFLACDFNSDAATPHTYSWLKRECIRANHCAVAVVGVAAVVLLRTQRQRKQGRRRQQQQQQQQQHPFWRVDSCYVSKAYSDEDSKYKVEAQHLQKCVNQKQLFNSRKQLAENNPRPHIQCERMKTQLQRLSIPQLNTAGAAPKCRGGMRVKLTYVEDVLWYSKAPSQLQHNHQLTERKHNAGTNMTILLLSQERKWPLQERVKMEGKLVTNDLDWCG